MYFFKCSATCRSYSQKLPIEDTQVIVRVSIPFGNIHRHSRQAGGMRGRHCKVPQRCHSPWATESQRMSPDKFYKIRYLEHVNHYKYAKTLDILSISTTPTEKISVIGLWEPRCSQKKCQRRHEKERVAHQKKITCFVEPHEP